MKNKERGFPGRYPGENPQLPKLVSFGGSMDGDMREVMASASLADIPVKPLLDSIKDGNTINWTKVVLASAREADRQAGGVEALGDVTKILRTACDRGEDTYNNVLGRILLLSQISAKTKDPGVFRREVRKVANQI